MRVLVIEDDRKMASFIRRGLEAESHSVDVVIDGAQAATQAVSGNYDLILLDLMLPGMDGLEILRRVRKTDPTTPVLAVTARGGVEDRVRGLDAGADDYLVKPFSFVELTARIRAIFRRTGQPLRRRRSVGRLELDRLDRMVCVGTEALELTQREFQLLEYLMRHPDEPLTRAMLADRVWGYQFDTNTNVIDVYVNYLRKKLRKLGVEPIRTVRGIGYVFDSAACD